MILKNITVFVACLFSFCVQAQVVDTSFQQDWLDINSMIVKDNLPRTALDRVNNLYKKAKEQNLSSQIAQTLIYRYTLEGRLSDVLPNQSIQTLQSEIDRSTDKTLQAVLYSLLAKQYWQYYNNNRWKILLRKNTVDAKTGDIATWAANDFHRAITKNYMRSLRDDDLLKKQRSSVYAAVIIKGTDSIPITLYDLLVREALEYFKTGETTDILNDEPAITDTRMLGSINEFLQSQNKLTDSSSHQKITLELFRRVSAFHKEDIDKQLLLQWNIERIQWVYGRASFVGKERIYKKSLWEIANMTDVPTSAQAWLWLAIFELSKAASYEPFGDTAGRFGYVKATEIIYKALPLYSPSNSAAINLRNLLTQILHKELRTESERVNVPRKPIRALVSYRNTDTMYGRIIKLTDDKLQENIGVPDYWKKVARIKAYRSFVQALPGITDHQPHRVEIKIDALPLGDYALVSCNNERFNDSLDHMSIQFFTVSDISYVKNKNDYFVLNRETGKPIKDASVDIYSISYSSSQRKNITEKIASKTTDEHGYFRFNEPSQSRGMNVRFDITKGKDRLFLAVNDFVYFENRNGDEDDAALRQFETRSSRIFFFTDRAIYRPGQTAFFKGIGVIPAYKNKLSRILTSKDSVLVYLNDVNQKRIDSAKFVFNEYGSFIGRFQLPQNGLGGMYTLSVKGFNNSGTSFSVEEYKRPSFLVSFEKVKGSYRLEDSVAISGIAKSFNGSIIGNAKVVYTVERSVRERYPITRRIFARPANRSVANGEIITDEQGMFTIHFVAKVDDIVDPGDAIYNYSVSATVTDMNGETRNASTDINVAKSSLVLHLGVSSAPIDIDSLKKIAIYATNLAGEKQPATIKIKMYSLDAPAHPLRKRYWQRPDQYVMNRAEFTQWFPTDEFANESNYETWPIKEQAAEGIVHTIEKEWFFLPDSRLHPGYYKIEASATDIYGQETTTTQYVQLFSELAQIPAVLSLQQVYTVNKIVQPGETAVFIRNSTIVNPFVVRRTEKPGNSLSDYIFTTYKKSFEKVKYTATDSDRGGVHINEVFVYDNRIYTMTYDIDVPWKNKVLDIHYDSYRDKTEPGSKETWSVTIKNGQSEKAAAELLTGMYDASLDQFKTNKWNVPMLWPTTYAQTNFNGAVNFSEQGPIENNVGDKYLPYPNMTVDRLASSGYSLWNRAVANFNGDRDKIPAIRADVVDLNDEVRIGYGSTVDRKVFFGDGNSLAYKGLAAAPMMIRGNNYSEVQEANTSTGLPTDLSASEAIVLPRKNFNETAFFFPQLYADSTGKYSFSFTMPDATTQWKWMSLAHTKDLAFGTSTATIITQKKLMVTGNAPRFMREGDNMEFSAKITNLDDKQIMGQVSLELLDATTNTPVDSSFQNISSSQSFTVAAGQSFAVKFPIQIPVNFNKPLTWRVVARSGNMSDGEENVLPVLSNRVLVTESLPLLLQNESTKHFSFDKLLKTTSEALTHQSLTVEYTSNPVWSAVQALPYLIEYPYECAEQTFNRFYANTLASFIVNKNSLIKKIFEEWKKDTTSLKSNLAKNAELKQILLQETPWVMEAENETARKRNLANLFDMAQLSAQSNQFIEKLSQQQLPGGAFPWFKGGTEDRFITNYIVTGIGKLKKLGALTSDLSIRLRDILGNAVSYLDTRITDDYNHRIQSKSDTSTQQVSSTQIDYLYMRSFFIDIQQPSPAAAKYYYSQAKRFWATQNTYYQAAIGMIALRNQDKNFALNQLLPSILENAISDSSKGMYWKNAYASWWYQSPVEHQSMMIAFVSEAEREQKNSSLSKKLNLMKTWLLLNKQTNNWRTTIASADACYALLLTGSDWLSDNRTTTIQLGNYVVNSTDQKTEAGTGYFKKRIDGKMVQPSMGNITVTTSSGSNNTQPSWGSVYWQYFEDMDKVTPAAGPLSVSRKLFVERNTDKGKLLSPVKDNEELKTGDKVVIRMELRSDRDMEYLYLKDTRAACMEPINVLSEHKWQDGLGYYESTKDVSSNFFISHITKGTYIFDYPVYITHAGIFSAGMSTIQCMYAPEFTSHSAGMTIRVGKR